MRTDVRYAAIAILGLCVIALLVVSFSGPLLYSVEQDVFPSQFHENTEALKVQEIHSTTDVLPLMQDLLDYTGPIIINVRIHDIDQARKDLLFYARDRKLIDNLIVRLDMNGSELDEFSKSSANQEKILKELVNFSVSWDQLKSLEIQYRDADNPAMMTSIQLQGETLRRKIHSLYEQYRQESRTVITIGNKTGLDTTHEIQSVQEFDRYVNEIDPGQQQEPIDIPIRQTAQLSLLIEPDTGRYGDTISCFGYYFSLYGYHVSSIPGKKVTLYLDNAPVGTVTTDDVGSYTFTIPVDKVTSGTHIVHTESGLTQSDERSFAILPVDSVTALNTTLSGRAGEVICIGAVTANRPVQNAPVELVWDRTHVSRTLTDAQGGYSTRLSLPAGRHTVQARFTGEGYPINASQSEIREIVVPASLLPFDYRYLLYIAVFCLFSLFIAGAVYYLQRVPGRALFTNLWAALTGITAATGYEAGDTSDGGAGADRLSVTLPMLQGTAPDVTLFQEYTSLLQSAGLGEASHAVYSALAARIAHELRISRHQVLTPREMSRSCRERPYCGAFSRLVSVYERIRYGGYRSVPVREEFETTMQDTDVQLDGEHH